MAEALSTQAHEPRARRRGESAPGGPIYLEFKRMGVDPDTSEVRLALVADSGIDKFLLKERGYRKTAQKCAQAEATAGRS
ncbi:hypothetical protein N1Z41_00035885 [Pseudomonas aeruginosa]